MQAGMAGRAIALIGVVCGLVAIWTDALSGSGGSLAYWDDGTLGTATLVLIGATGVLLVLGAIVTNRRDVDFAAAAVGGIGVGLLLFIPVAYAFDQWDLVGEGGFLGICALLAPLGALIAYLTTPPQLPTAVEQNTPIGALLALVGTGLVFAGIWTDVNDDGATYWRFENLGHSPGIFLIIMGGVSALLALGAYARVARAADLAVPAAAVTLGFAAFGPVVSAFDQFGTLREGAWLALAGGVVLLAGAIVLRGAPLRAKIGAPVPAK